MPDPKRYEEFAGLVRVSTSQVLSYINALLLNWNDAEDVFQETCVVLWQKFDEFRPGTNFLAWALRIAQHKAMDFQKKQSRQTAFQANLRDSLLDEVANRGVERASAGLTALADCMERLSPSDRELLTLCYGEGVPVRQVADELGRSPQSIHNSLGRIRKVLLECITRQLNQAAPAAPLGGAADREDRP